MKLNSFEIYGEKIGEIIVKNKDEVVKKLPLFAAEDLKKVNFFRRKFLKLSCILQSFRR